MLPALSVCVLTVRLTAWMQLPPEHMYAAEMQSALVAQVVLHALIPQMNGVHERAAGVTQVPVPLQLDAGCSVEVTQVCALHSVPLAYFWQAPFPSQYPSIPQL